MGLFPALTAVSSSAPLASRAFIPLFVVCLLAACPGLCDAIGLSHIVVPQHLSWLTSAECLAVLGVLAVLEILADKNPEIQELMSEVHRLVKAAAAVLVTLMVLPPGAVNILDGGQAAGLFSGHTLLAVGTGATTWYLAGQRNTFYSWLREVDDGDEWHMQLFVSLTEDLWSFVAILFFIILPIVALVLAGLLYGFVIAVNRYLEHLENRERTPCPNCQTEILPTAMRCKGCGGELHPARLLNWNLFGGDDIATEAPGQAQDHRLRLLSRNRCPACGEKVPARKFIDDGCAACNYRFDTTSGDWFEAYRQAVMRRGWVLLIPILAVSFIPVVGFSVAYVAIKLMVARPLRVFIGGARRFGIRWGLRLVLLLLLVPSCIPLLSILSVPVLFVINLAVYGHYARRAVSRPALLPAAAGTEQPV